MLSHDLGEVILAAEHAEEPSVLMSTSRWTVNVKTLKSHSDLSTLLLGKRY